MDYWKKCFDATLKRLNELVEIRDNTKMNYKQRAKIIDLIETNLAWHKLAHEKISKGKK